MQRSRLTARIRDERGVALPLALLGLVSVSLLVSTALMTSSTELAISGAHQDATVSLHAAEGSVQEYVGRMVGATATTPSPLVPITRDPLVPNFQITVTELFVRQDTVNSGRTVRRMQTFGLLAEPASGRGRSVAAQVTTVKSADLFQLSVNAGLTVGGDIEVTGSSSISDGRSTGCALGPAENALQVSAGSTITKGGSATIEGTADTASYTKEQMVEQLLGGMTLQEAVRYANVKFGPGEFSGRVKSHDSGVVRPRSNKYNWGCPAGDPCATVAGNTDNRNYYPMVALDAGGGKVVLEGNHGQGVLVIHNGSVEIKGNLVFEGIIVVEKDLLVQGTGGGGVKIQGAVVALGQNSSVKDNTAGNAVITYNKCITDAAQNGANQQRINSAPQTFPDPVLGWTEVVR